MYFRGSTNLKAALGTSESTLKIKSMVTALLYTRMDQDTKVKRAHRADFWAVKLLFGDRTCLWMLGRTRELQVLQVGQALCKHGLCSCVLRADAETRKP